MNDNLRSLPSEDNGEYFPLWPRVLYLKLHAIAMKTAISRAALSTQTHAGDVIFHDLLRTIRRVMACMAFIMLAIVAYNFVSGKSGCKRNPYPLSDDAGRPDISSR